MVVKWNSAAGGPGGFVSLPLSVSTCLDWALVLLVAQMLLPWIQGSDRMAVWRRLASLRRRQLVWGQPARGLRGGRRLELRSSSWRRRVLSPAVDYLCTSLAGTEISPFYEVGERKNLCKVIVLHLHLDGILFICISVTHCCSYHGTKWKVHDRLCP